MDPADATLQSPAALFQGHAGEGGDSRAMIDNPRFWTLAPSGLTDRVRAIPRARALGYRISPPWGSFHSKPEELVRPCHPEFVTAGSATQTQAVRTRHNPYNRRC